MTTTEHTISPLLASSRSTRSDRRIARLRRGVVAAAALGLLIASPRVASAQAASRPSMDRASLEKLAGTERRAEETTRLRERLRDGDFNVGDRIVLDLRRDTSVTHDTLIVRAGRIVAIEGLPDIPLQGVLRSELDAYLAQRVGRYIRSPDVRTSTLFRVAVLGEVSKPNYYDVRPDMLISDLVVLAGGPTPNADLNRSIARRGTVELLQPERFRYALRNGQTLDELSFRAGDEVSIGHKRNLNLATIVTTTALGISLLVGVFSLLRR
jgi:SLBB domain